jgi:hypothetical protein
MGIFMVIFASGQSTASESTQQTNPVKSSGKILVVMTNHATYPSRSDTTGLWLTELLIFMMLLKQQDTTWILSALKVVLFHWMNAV